MSDLKSKMIERHIAALKAIEGKHVEVGWFESDRYEASKKGGTVGLSVAFVARVNNFGATVTRTVNGKQITITIPPRPFMQLAWSNFLSNRKAIQDRILKRFMAGQITADQALEQVGMSIEGHVVKSIKNGEWQKNADSTVARKGFDSPLRDTGHLWKTVNYKVIKGA